MIDTDVFPEQLKWAEVKPAHKKDSRNDRKTTDLSVFYQIYQKFMKDVYSNN